MARTSTLLLLPASLLVLALGLSWLGSQPAPIVDADASAAGAGPPACAPPEPARIAGADVQRAELPPAAVAPPPVVTPPTLVRVHGQVLRCGRPVGGCDLSFHVDGPAGQTNEVEWDFTDSDGRYEVELPAARYVVSSEDAAPWWIEILVPADRRNVVLDFYLPP